MYYADSLNKMQLVMSLLKYNTQLNLYYGVIDMNDEWNQAACEGEVTCYIS